MVLSLEMGWRHLFIDGTLRDTDVSYEPWTVYPAAAVVEADTHWAVDGFDRPSVDPVRSDSPGLDVVAEPSKRAPPEVEA